MEWARFILRKETVGQTCFSDLIRIKCGKKPNRELEINLVLRTSTEGPAQKPRERPWERD